MKLSIFCTIFWLLKSIDFEAGQSDEHNEIINSCNEAHQ